MKLTFFFLLWVAFIGLSAQQLPITKDLDKRFSPEESFEYTFQIKNVSNVGSARLVLLGTDYDSDFDGDYSDFSIIVNGTEILFDESFHEIGMPADGDLGEVSFNISQYLVDGENTILLQNSESAEKKDFFYIKTLSILGTSFQVKKIETNSWVNVNEKFKSFDQMEFRFDMDDLSETGEAVLVLNGSDYDKDEDGDYTEFSITVNDYKVLDQEPLFDQGMPGDGEFGEVPFDILGFLQEGENFLVIENTEYQGQKDFVHIKELLISTGGYTTETLVFEDDHLLAKRFNSQAKSYFEFEIDNLNDINSLTLVLNGSDYDEDNDEDFTDFAITVNGDDVIWIEPLYTHGMPGDGTNGDVAFDIFPYLIEGTNSLVLENTEDPGQTDYTFIHSLKITQEGFASRSIKLNEDVNLSQRLEASSEQAFRVYIDDLEDYKHARLELTGTDYDGNGDGTYGTYELIINDQVLINGEPLHEHGLGKNKGEETMTLDLGSFLKRGQNAIILKNLVGEEGSDYVFVRSMAIYTHNHPIIPAFVNEDIMVEEEFGAAYKEEYSFFLDDTTGLSLAKLIIHGSDHDHDEDEDYTDFTITLNGGEIIFEETLFDNGLTADGVMGDITFDIYPYLQPGNNSIILENTELEEQEDFIYIEKIRIEIPVKDPFGFVEGMPPILKITDIQFPSDILNGMDTAVLKISVENIGPGPARGVGVDLLSESRAISFLQEGNTIEEIQPGKSKTLDLKMIGETDLETGEETFDIEVFEPGFKIRLPRKKITIPTQRFPKPEFEVISSSVTEFQSVNPDHQIDQNEIMDFSVVIQNVGKGKAKDLQIQINQMQKGIMKLGQVQKDKLVKENLSLKKLSPGESIEVAYRFFVNSEFEEKDLEFMIRVTEGTSNFTMEKDQKIPLHGQFIEEGELKDVNKEIIPTSGVFKVEDL